MTLWSVLVVDDNPAVRKLICELFTGAGDFEVCGEASNGSDAVELARSLRPNLVLTDLSMPVMNGLEETRLLKKVLPAIPVIIYSAHIDPFVEKEALAAGAAAVVPKAEAVALLVSKSRDVLGERQLDANYR